MKSKIFIFATLILVVFLFVITSCDNFLNTKNKTTININLDLSKILKTSRNETTSNPTEYILKVFAYNAATYKPKDEIQNLPLLTQSENKVDINGNVKASLDVEIGLNVIFVAKLYQGKSEKPLYAGNSKVIKIKATDNKVHLVLTSENTDLDVDILVHEHTFATDWTSNATHHWHEATCEHDVTDSKAEHSFVNEVCTICEYSRIPEGFVLIPAGTFQMGSEQGDSSNKPVHQVTITKSFYMGKYEVTQAEYEKYCSYTGSNSPNSTYGVGNNYPVYYVSWYDALVYCNKRSMAEGLSPCYSISGNTDPSKWGTVPTSYNSTWDAVVCDWKANGYRLPTEAEWEYAARAGDDTVDALTYSGTSDVNELGDYAWYKDNSNNTTHEVGMTKANAFGLYDMSGNVFEWCWNWSTNSYDTTTEGENDPIGASSGLYRVCRGGSWNRDSNYCAVSCRNLYYPYSRGSNLGFRVVRTATEVIENLAHTHKFATDWTKDETHHWHAATCEHTTEVSGKAAHSFGNWTTTKEATEEAEGSKERSCTICGYKATEVIPKLDHTHKFTTEWISDATGHWHSCNCGEKSEFATHTFEWEITQNPTETEKGEKTGTCTVCDYNETVEIEKIPEGFVFVKGGTVTGALPAWLDESASDYYKGVFIKGRTVTLSDFYMGKYEVTQEEYASVMQGQKVTVNGTEYTLASDPSQCKKDSTYYTLFEGDEQTKRPVEGVSWYDAVWYCNTLSAKEGLTKAYNIEVTSVKQFSGTNYIYGATVTLNKDATGYRLPTEAEWEYAARGGDPTKPDWNYTFSGADTAEGVSYDSEKNAGLDSVGWYCYNNITGISEDSDVTTSVSGEGTHQVGKKVPNRLGLYDMSGNVYEWCYDWKGTVSAGTESDPTGTSAGSYHIYRGGGWYNIASYASVSCRYDGSPCNLNYGLGFRVVRPATE